MKPGKLQRDYYAQHECSQSSFRCYNIGGGGGGSGGSNGSGRGGGSGSDSGNSSCSGGRLQNSHIFCEHG